MTDRIILPCACLLSIVTLCTAGEGDWPQFRGPGSRGVAVDGSPPETWSATENIAKLWALSIILADNGYHIELIKTRRPGYVVYEDDVQVVAEPFKDLNA